MFSLGSEYETKRVVGLLKKQMMLYGLGFGDFFGDVQLLLCHNLQHK